MRSVLCHISPRLAAIALCVAFAGCGCTTTPVEPPPPASNPMNIAQTWRTALVANDADAALALVSDDFSSTAWPSRDDLADYLHLAQSRGFFAGATPLPDDPRESRSGNDAAIYPVSLRAAIGTVVFRLVLRESGSEWKISSATLEIY